MEYRKSGRVFRVRFVPPAQGDLFASPRDQLEQTLTPGNRTSRYKRTWLVGQTQIEGDILTGRIGFVSEGSTEIYDDNRKDFIDVLVPSGTTASFAINLETLEALLQAGIGDLQIQGLIGAFRDLLLRAGWRWRIVGLRNEVTLAEWKASVTKILSVRFTIKQPNPNYIGRESLKELMEELNTEVIRLEATNEDEGVNLDTPFIQQTEAHVEKGYGDGEYRGLKMVGSEVRESVYATDVGLEEDYEEVVVNQSTGEVPPDRLRSMLTSGDEADNTNDVSHDDPFSHN